MLALVQRVCEARVNVGDEVVGAIGRGLLAFVCAQPGDTPAQARKMVDKLLKLRIFGDATGRMNLSVRDIGGGLLIVSQFTLAADTRGGNRPSFSAAAPPAVGEALYEEVLRLAREAHSPVEAGRFGAEMQVALVNDGPVTIPIGV